MRSLSTNHESSEGNNISLVDIGINITHKALEKHWVEIVKRAIDANVHTILLTGTSIQSSKESLAIARDWFDNHGQMKNLLCTVGIHPHEAKSFKKTSTHCPDSGRITIDSLQEMYEIAKDNPFVVAIGECGLDYNRNFSSKQDQIYAFREQIKLACELQIPLFVHEREAHADLVQVLDEVEADDKILPLPPIVIHCFTGNVQEATAYLERGYYIGFTGTICKKERGAPLRDLLPSIPLERIMVETDAPFMGFVKGKRRHSEPAHVVGVAEEISRTLNIPFEDVCHQTTQNARRFFKLHLFQ